MRHHRVNLLQKLLLAVCDVVQHVFGDVGDLEDGVLDLSKFERLDLDGEVSLILQGFGESVSESVDVVRRPIVEALEDLSQREPSAMEVCRGDTLEHERHMDLEHLEVEDEVR